MDEQKPQPPSEAEIEKLIKEEEIARERMQEALRHSPLAKVEDTPVPEPSKIIAEQTEDPKEEKKKSEETQSKDTKEKGIPGVTIHKTNDKDTLIDVHVNNPLKRVIMLLEDIKKQKAFSFTLKGSLGIMGVILTLSVFGLFGGNKVLCEKGLQTRTGTLRILQLTEEHTDPDVPWSRAMLMKLFGVSQPITRQRTVLLSANEPPIHLFMTLKDKPSLLNGSEVIVTGTFNSCSSTLSVANEQSLEPLMQ